MAVGQMPARHFPSLQLPASDSGRPYIFRRPKVRRRTMAGRTKSGWGQNPAAQSPAGTKSGMGQNPVGQKPFYDKVRFLPKSGGAKSGMGQNPFCY